MSEAYTEWDEDAAAYGALICQDSTMYSVVIVKKKFYNVVMSKLSIIQNVEEADDGTFFLI
ncbi:hypothetical protein [Paenibacillus sp. PL91]|uniref:hypothetical protein n=1 Tax=Paenibacillus sp. PL91 TaxID=2729538 RepID=UPI00145E1E2F|nr:hypothetical protein [Paenibacillus sp. PL91]MBC9199052.1 hypothetical protein [Paenibacillus sp. PL91]